MVRKAVAEQIAEMSPEPRVDPRFDWGRLWRAHKDYWDAEAVAQRHRFEATMGGLHLQDDFRIVCDGQINGQDCGRVIGYAPFPENHDGLCESCRARGVDFPPRIHMTPDGIFAMTLNGPAVVRVDERMRKAAGDA